MEENTITPEQLLVEIKENGQECQDEEAENVGTE